MSDKFPVCTQPRIGVGVIVTHRQKVLFGKRTTTDGGFVWQLPGGWIEAGESPEQTARREVTEETGLGLDELILVGLTNNNFSDQNHSISLYFEAECSGPGIIANREADKLTWRHTRTCWYKVWNRRMQ